jgi:uncharacterized damage-inducible protein DinB
MKKLFLAKIILLACFLNTSFLSTSTAFAQKPPEGIWEGYDGEWKHVTSQLIALAEATPEDKFAWRPAKGVRSTSEVYMHIAVANFYLLSITGPKMPEGVTAQTEKAVTSKAEVIKWLKRSLEAVRAAHASITPADLQRKVHIADRDATVDGMYLRIIVHGSCKRAHGTTGGVRAHDRRCTAVVAIKTKAATNRSCAQATGDNVNFQP